MVLLKRYAFTRMETIGDNPIFRFEIPDAG